MTATVNDSRRGRGGFTLVELLVVIGILGLLVAMLIPSLRQAKEQAYSARCRANLHQLWGLLHGSDSGSDPLMPRPYQWVPHVQQRAGLELMQCPKEAGRDGTTDLSNLYFSQSGRTFNFFYDLMAGEIHDSQLYVNKLSSTEVEIFWRNRPERTYYCGYAKVTLGDPVVVSTYDHPQHGSCGSYHYVCWGDGGPDWESEVILRLKGPTAYKQVNPPAVISGAPVSYAMNNQVRRVPSSADQLLLLEYHKRVADVDGAGNNDDDLEEQLAPRHLGRVNLVTIDGAVRGMLPSQLDATEGIWKP